MLRRVRAFLRPPPIRSAQKPEPVARAAVAGESCEGTPGSVEPALSDNDRLLLPIIRTLVRTPNRLGEATYLVLSFESRVPGCTELRDIAGDLVVACCRQIKAFDEQGAQLLGLVCQCAAIVPNRCDVVQAMDEAVHAAAPHVRSDRPGLFASTLTIVAKLLVFTPGMPKLETLARSLVDQALALRGQQPLAAPLLACEAVLNALPDIGEDQALRNRLAEAFLALATGDDATLDPATRLHCTEVAAGRADHEGRSRLLHTLVRAIPTNEIDGPLGTELRDRIAVLSFFLDPTGDLAVELKYPGWLVLRRETLEQGWRQNAPGLFGQDERASLVVIHLPTPLAHLTRRLAGPEPCDWPALRKMLQDSRDH